MGHRSRGQSNAGLGQPLEAGKDEEMDDSLEPLEGTQPCQSILDLTSKTAR